MINRAKMPRQLRNKGGITNVTPRTNYFLGGIKDRIRKLIPNEIANVAVKAAPFVAPFNPAVAGLMRGIGRFDQRGSISDAFKQGLGTYAGGQLFRTVGGAGPQEGLGGFKFSSPLSPDRTTAVKDFFTRKNPLAEEMSEVSLSPSKKATEGTGLNIGKSIKDATGLFKDTPILKDLPSIVQQQILVGGASGALTYIYQKYLADYPPIEAGEDATEYYARRREKVGGQMKAYFDNYFKFDKEYSSMTDEQKQAFIDRVNVKDGGRIGFEEGGTGFMKWLKANYGLEVKDLDLDQYVKFSREFNNENPDPYETGREKNAKGSMPTGIMKTNKAGVMERDYRDKGGFVPVGIKEKADDVPAMLSKNEFVMTADAVRGAGNGSIEKGAQRMYDTMKNLEKRVV